ncbi:MAG TPA: hypothetical protein VLD37_06935 [Candidatus Bilamarchaeum sp.]|nr:hypothetical protein [Candidatus Bilamarchaeum sp.]
MAEGRSIAASRMHCSRDMGEIGGDVQFYRRTLARLAGGSGVNREYMGRKDAFAEAIPILDRAFSRFEKGNDEFSRFKFGAGFRDELEAKYPHKGFVLFHLWREDSSGRLESGGSAFTLSETGAFADSFYGGIVKDMQTCVDPHNGGFHVGGIIGTIELPWIKQVTATLPGEREFVFRRRVFLVDGGDHPIILVQPIYHGLSDTDASLVNSALMDAMRIKYEGTAEVREMPNAMLSHEVRTEAHPEGVNTGYSTFTSGRSPFFYIDSNCHVLKCGELTIARNGLHSRRQGESVRFPRGWSSEKQLIPDEYL